MFTRNQYAALFHDVGGKHPASAAASTASRRGLSSIGAPAFFIGLLSRGLACQQTQLAISLAARYTEKAELLDAMQRSPCIDMFGIVPQ